MKFGTNQKMRKKQRRVPKNTGKFRRVPKRIFVARFEGNRRGCSKHGCESHWSGESNKGKEV